LSACVRRVRRSRPMFLCAASIYAALVGALLACSPAPPAAAPSDPLSSTPAAKAPHVTAPRAPFARGLTRVESHRLGLGVELPDLDGWRLNDVDGPWLRGVHATTESRIAVRTWSAPRSVRPSDCEAQVRLWRSGVPGDEPNALLETHVLDTATGFRFEVKVGWVDVEPGKGEGFLLAFGARPRRCVALVYVTAFAGSVDDAAVRDVVLDRLGTIDAQVVPTLSVLGAESRIQSPAAATDSVGSGAPR